MANNISVFTNSEFGSVRTVEIDGEPWFVAKDVALALGYSKPRNAVSVHIEPEDKKDALIQGPLGGAQTMTIINESGLYALILSSKLPNAKKFSRWVTGEVLPTIRKHGAYVTQELLERLAASENKVIELVGYLKSSNTYSLKLEKKLMSATPKCDFYDDVLQSKGLIPVTLIAKDYGMSAARMNSILHERGVQYRMPCGTWVLYSKYQDKGYTKTVTYYNTVDGEVNVRLFTYWTMSGRQFIYELLKKDGILPKYTSDMNTEDEEDGD